MTAGSFYLPVCYTAGLTVSDFKDADSIGAIEYKHKSGVDVSSKQCAK